MKTLTAEQLKIVCDLINTAADYLDETKSDCANVYHNISHYVFEIKNLTELIDNGYEDFFGRVSFDEHIHTFYKNLLKGLKEKQNVPRKDAVKKINASSEI